MGYINTMSAKTAETKFNQYLSQLIYAALEDLKNRSNNEPKYSKYMFHSYSTVTSKEKAEGLKHIFTISTDVKQYLCFIMNKYVEEISVIDIYENDTSETIRDRLLKETTDGYSVLVWDAASYLKHYGKTLSEAGDTTKYFHAMIGAKFPRYAAKPTIVALIYSRFEYYLKSLAMLFAAMIWYTDGSINSALFLGTHSQMGMPQDNLDEIAACLREKPPAKPRKKAAEKTETTTAEPTVETKMEPTQVDAPTDDLSDMLGSI